MPKILAFTIRPVEAADTRYRILLYKSHFKRAGFEINHRSFLTPSYWERQLGGQNRFSMVFFYLFYTLRRLLQIIFLAPRHDAIWIGRELSPIGPPWLERILFMFNPRVVLDIDDAVYLRDIASNSFIHKRLRDFGKFARLAPKYAKIVCGNSILAEYFQSFTNNLEIIPTVVQAERYAAIQHRPAQRLRIGWIGSPSNRYHLNLLDDAMKSLSMEQDFEFVVIGLTRPLDWTLPHIRYINWELERECDYFSEFDIGVMPLYDSPFSRGKCAFKIIQYMAAGIPCVASPVGVNKQIVRHGENGFLAGSAPEWGDCLGRLLNDQELRRKFGEAGRRTVEREYSLDVYWQRYLDIFREVVR